MCTESTGTRMQEQVTKKMQGIIQMKLLSGLTLNGCVHSLQSQKHNKPEGTFPHSTQ